MKELLDIVDARLDFWVSQRLNALPGSIPEDMATGESSDDWKFWVPVPSRVTAADLEEIETTLGAKLSPQYKAVLQHRHFLDLHIGDVGFFPHPTVGWKNTLLTEALGNYGFLLERRLLPFAMFSDWGLWCFALAESDPNGEYHIHQWDHERADETDYVATSLLEGLKAQHVSVRT
jgi:hypothetical protein